MKQLTKTLILIIVATLGLVVSNYALAAAPPATNPRSGSIGVNGRITSSAPSQAPTIATPSDGSAFSALPIKVSGLCKSDLLVEVFKNNAFSGSAKCANGSYSIQIDLFSGRNDLIARQYDGLNQASPDSNKVVVNFNDQVQASGPQLILLSAYATRGANPGSELTWPLSISGGTAPYALSVDWGDATDPVLMSQQFSGNFNIYHTYSSAGSFNVTIKATDSKGEVAFLQVVGVGNGAIQASSGSTSSSGTSNAASQPAKTKILWAPIVVLAAMIGVAFWLGQMHQIAAARAQLDRMDKL